MVVSRTDDAEKIFQTAIDMVRRKYFIIFFSYVFAYRCDTESTKNARHWTVSTAPDWCSSRKNSLELIQLFSIYTVSLV